MPTKQHEKHPLLGAHVLCQDGQMLLLHFNQLPFILHGITGNDDHTNNKYKKLHQKMNKSGAKLKHAKPIGEIRSCKNIAHSFIHFMGNPAIGDFQGLS